MHAKNYEVTVIRACGGTPRESMEQLFKFNSQLLPAKDSILVYRGKRYFVLRVDFLIEDQYNGGQYCGSAVHSLEVYVKPA